MWLSLSPMVTTSVTVVCIQWDCSYGAIWDSTAFALPAGRHGRVTCRVHHDGFAANHRRAQVLKDSVILGGAKAVLR